jgi:hypothetical protein
MSKVLPQKNSIKKTGFRITDTGFEYRSSSYLYTEIKHLRRCAVNLTTTYVGVGSQQDTEISIIIITNDDKRLILSEQNTTFHTSDPEAVEFIKSSFKKLQSETHDQRYKRWMNQIKQDDGLNFGGKFFLSLTNKSIKTNNREETPISGFDFKRIYGGILFKKKNYSPPIYLKLLKYLFGYPKSLIIPTPIDEDVLLFILRNNFGIRWT